MYEFDWSSIVPSMPYLLDGLLITLKITVIAIVVGIVWGTLLAVMRLSAADGRNIAIGQTLAGAAGGGWAGPGGSGRR